MPIGKTKKDKVATKKEVKPANYCIEHVVVVICKYMFELVELSVTRIVHMTHVYVYTAYLHSTCI